MIGGADGEPPVARLRVLLRGAVQGLGVRPAIYRQARRRGLTGWVRNAGGGVELEVEGRPTALRSMLAELRERFGAAGVDAAWQGAAGYRQFTILASATGGAAATAIPLDRTCCADCLRELFDPADRRFRYPFINCTACGPRFSIIERLPYDRERTSMRAFEMCRECRREFDDPDDRRFHAQPIACAQCGPQLALWDGAGRVLARRDQALLAAAARLRQGQVLALKGLGGFHLLVDAGNPAAVARLRRRKRRPDKPLALMVPGTDDLAAVCSPTALELELLASPAAPIVLVRRSGMVEAVADGVAPGYPDLGVMLPCTPLHHLLLRELGRAVVATSGNAGGEPLCRDEREALGRLAGVADAWLVHDRPIVNRIDDSIVRTVADRAQVLRCARGYAPMMIACAASPAGTLATGGHLKVAPALALPAGIVLAPHVGDLGGPLALQAFGEAVAALQRLSGGAVARLRCDLHPDYATTVWAATQRLPVAAVQHHYAHALACRLDNAVSGAMLAVTWDGAGRGTDGTLWGGEFLRLDGDGGFERVAHWRRFALPGGEAAAREPRRAAVGLLAALYGGDLAGAQEALPPLRDFAPHERRTLVAMVEQRINAPYTSSVGRLFDAAAALLGLCQRASCEGHAASLLENLARAAATRDAYPVVLRRVGGVAQLDWESGLRALLADISARVAPALCAARFHNMLVEGIVAVARCIGLEQVALSGGCFQNRLLAEAAVARLREAGFRPCWHRRIPANDGGLAVGQLLAGER